MSIMIARTSNPCGNESARFYASPTDRPGAAEDRRGDLLQIAASALHLIDRQLDEDLRPLVRAGLAAIRQVATTY